MQQPFNAFAAVVAFAVNLVIGHSLLSGLAILRRVAFRICKGLQWTIKFSPLKGVEFTIIGQETCFRPAGPAGSAVRQALAGGVSPRNSCLSIVSPEGATEFSEYQLFCRPSGAWEC